MQNLQSYATIGVTSCIIYFNVISAPLLYDDAVAVISNPDVQVRELFALFKDTFSI